MFEKQIAAGVALLNEKRPGWYNEIDISRFDMNNPCGCVVGQLFGNFYDAMEAELGLVESQELSGTEFCEIARQYGFTDRASDDYKSLHECKRCWDTLEKEWIETILSLRSK